MVYQDYFSKLLRTEAAKTEGEKTTEKMVEHITERMEELSKITKPLETTKTNVEEVVNGLNTRKAKDIDDWSNEIVVGGGTEMVSSLVKIFGIMDRNMEIPDEWKKMLIKTIDKKGSKLLMTNKRGLFLTNIISKIYERVLKNRNEEEVKKKRCQWQMGGVKKRSTTDNLFILNAVIERNKYLGKPTYVFYADAEKCFDKLWLQDSIIELWESGTHIRDAVMVLKMNEEAVITIKTPVGETEEVVARFIVRQGTVYGHQLCGVSMSRVNTIGKDIITFYGPKLIIRATEYVDDVSSAGSAREINNTVNNCRLLEENKKMIFNNQNGKTEYTLSMEMKTKKKLQPKLREEKLIKLQNIKH